MNSEVTRGAVANWRNYSKYGVLYGVEPKDRSKLKCFSIYVITQCIVIFVGVATVLQCLWNPADGTFELEILSRIMYLYDTEACGTTTSLKQVKEMTLSNETYGLAIRPIKRQTVLINVVTKLSGKTRTRIHYEPIKELTLSNETYGLAIRPIKRQTVVINVVTKLSGKTRTYLKLSLGLHIIWLTTAIIAWVFAKVSDLKILKRILRIFLYTSYLVVIFDFCVAAVYTAHIQQALTKAMIIRYSGWGMVRNVEHLDEFGGWVPLMAAAAWLRGFVFFFINIYLCSFLRRLIHNIRGKEVKSKLDTFCNIPFPDANYNQKGHRGTLHFRAGEDNKF